MRKLLYVPIIHSEQDLGSLGPAINKRSSALIGQKRWAEHQETVSRFWQRVADYLLSLDSVGLKIYQDGLAAGGEVGRSIVEQATSRGSKNHQLILELINKGAKLMQTEDASLLIEEYKHIVALGFEGQGDKKISEDTRYGLRRDRLMQERDQYIAKTINETLLEGETAILFIGAFHNVLSYLDGDIAVEQVKDIDAVRTYFRELFSALDENRYQQLAGCLASPIANSHKR